MQDKKGVKIMKPIKCNVCACEFIPEKNEHYISRNEIKIGLSTIAGGLEEKLYDTFDCPQCGCQMIMQERKRQLCLTTVDNIAEEESEGEEETIPARPHKKRVPPESEVENDR